MPPRETYPSIANRESQETLGQLQLSRAIIFNPEGEVLLIERGPSQSFDTYKYELPGGKINQDEEIDDAIIREVLEETGLQVELPEQKEMEDTRTMTGGAYDGVQAVTHLKIALTDTYEINQDELENPEHISYRWASKVELQEMAESGEISKTVLQAINNILLVE